ncbi:hypothetical protein [Methanobacterium petrolearium]|uniref:hypothetical protein n=1 Tax=Methanobacterium petrolearium TaxID=710190 RepID=UPI0030817351|nr:hypothetical protein [Methanobacterium petrolearium]
MDTSNAAEGFHFGVEIVCKEYGRPISCPSKKTWLGFIRGFVALENLQYTVEYDKRNHNPELY